MTSTTPDALPGIIRGWFQRTCTYPGCDRRKPKFTRLCHYHAGPDNENA